jgi:hypothetical protein
LNNYVEKNLEGKNRGLIEALSRHLPGETVENHENDQDIRCPNKADSTKHMPRALLLC